MYQIKKELVMDETLRNAISRRDTLRRELEAWDAFIAAYSAQFRDTASSDVSQADLFTERKPTRAGRREAVRLMMDEAERLILAAGRPLSRSQLLEQLETNGFKVEGGDKSKVLGTNLWRSARFHSIKSAGYWPRATPIPAPFDQFPVRGEPES
jgi:hypothetical protein